MNQLGIGFEECFERFETQVNLDKFRRFSLSGTVPCLVDGETTVWDSLAIVEYLAEERPEVWPSDLLARAYARCACAEMHSSFSTLRNLCPMNCGIKVDMEAIPGPLKQDIDRIDEIWCEGLDRFGGPFLAGDKFSAADAFYCPVVFRIQSYQLPVSSKALAYCQRLLALPSMQAWDQAAILEPWREESHEEEATAVGRIIEDRRQS